MGPKGPHTPGQMAVQLAPGTGAEDWGGRVGKGQGGALDWEELRRLCELMREEGLTELTLVEEGRRITLRRPGLGVSPRAAEAPPRPELEEELIRSPVVGTFWRRPAPGEDPFVEVGERVEPGQTLCVVEAMKVMNEVRADRAGVIEEVLVEEGQPVEYGQPLFRLRPS